MSLPPAIARIREERARAEQPAQPERRVSKRRSADSGDAGRAAVVPRTLGRSPSVSSKPTAAPAAQPAAPLTRRKSFAKLIEGAADTFAAGSVGAAGLERLQQLEQQTREAKAAGAANYKELKHDFYDQELALRLALVDSNLKALHETAPDALSSLGRRRRSSDHLGC